MTTCPTPRSRAAGAVLAALTVGVLAGCGGSEPPLANDEPSAAPVDELAAHDGKVCPRRLPRSQDPDLWLGPTTPAESAPSLPPPESAWVCRYQPVDPAPGPDADDARPGWARDGEVRRVPPGRLPALERSLGQLEPAPDDRMCTADLGPRWMLVQAHDNDLTGVVVDEFGCRDVRLTDEPFETAVGEASQPGTVPGVLTGPASLLDLLQSIHPRR